MIPAQDIKCAADCLLDVLFDEIEVRYSRFYDGTDETSDHLMADMGFPDAEGYRPESAELLMDLAASELERQGFVEIIFLADKFFDGEPDYIIKLTEKGCGMFCDGKEPVFRDLDF